MNDDERSEKTAEVLVEVLRVMMREADEHGVVPLDSDLGRGKPVLDELLRLGLVERMDAERVKVAVSDAALRDVVLARLLESE